METNGDGLPERKTRKNAKKEKAEPKIKMRDSLKHMMYGFGDVPEPLDESVDLMEDMMLEFVQQMTLKSMQVNVKEDGKITLDDLLFILRKDIKKYTRAIELIHSHKEISKYRKVFEWRQT